MRIGIHICVALHTSVYMKCVYEYTRVRIPTSICAYVYIYLHTDRLWRPKEVAKTLLSVYMSVHRVFIYTSVYRPLMEAQGGGKDVVHDHKPHVAAILGLPSMQPVEPR